MPRPSRRAPPPSDLGPVWEVDLSPIGISIANDPAARPALLLVVANGYILTGDVVSHPSAIPGEIAATLAEPIRAAIATTDHKPATIHVRHRDVAAALGELLRPAGIDVRAAKSLPQVDDALHSFDQVVVGREPERGPRPRAARPETWAGWGLATEQIARLFSAAAAYYRAAPWGHITNEDVVRAKVQGGGSWSASVMGMAEEVYGLALYARHEDLTAILAGGAPNDTMGRLGGSVLSFSYDRREDLPRAMRKEVRDARWEVAGPVAYPTLIAINTPGGGITAREMEDLIALLAAIPAFTVAHERVLDGVESARFPLRWRDRARAVAIVFEAAPGRFG